MAATPEIATPWPWCSVKEKKMVSLFLILFMTLQYHCLSIWMLPRSLLIFKKCFCDVNGSCVSFFSYPFFLHVFISNVVSFVKVNFTDSDISPKVFWKENIISYPLACLLYSIEMPRWHFSFSHHHVHLP